MSNAIKQSDIKITIGLDESNMPVSMTWQAEDAGQAPQECKAMLLSLFDRDSMDTLKIDLWTKDMQVIEMDRFFFQTLRAMADTYYKATQNAQLASEMQRFVQYFGEKTEILPPSQQ
ncbi:MAG: gliding motility protein GldC [Saprospiraceae bacterium]|nr:gliding motility protein GldC [Saprospiraceae bacterium]